MATALVENRVLSLVEQRIRSIQVPLNLKLWNGQAFAPPEPSPVTVTVNSPQALMHLADPSLRSLLLAEEVSQHQHQIGAEFHISRFFRVLRDRFEDVRVLQFHSQGSNIQFRV